jgi:hypothetical protein
MSEANSESTATIPGMKSRRRTQRVQIAMPVMISGGPDIHAFSQLTKTVTVSAHGCLVHLNALVFRSQELLIVNPGTLQQVRGTIAYLGENTPQAREVGIEFLEPSPKFWGITFPPEDWDASERKLPSREAPRPARSSRLR